MPGRDPRQWLRGDHVRLHTEHADPRWEHGYYEPGSVWIFLEHEPSGHTKVQSGGTVCRFPTDKLERVREIPATWEPY